MIDVTNIVQAQTWDAVEVNDALLFQNGAIFVVIELCYNSPVNDHITFIVRCIMPSELGFFKTGLTSVLNSSKNASLASMGITLVKGKM
jgi:hypothetical protein